MSAYRKFAIFTAVWALVVILLGAYTRLTDAGLGCPDWPTCYGHIIVPEHESHVEDKSYLEQRPLEPDKAWNEVIHRAFAGSLGIWILVLAIWAQIRRRKDPDQPLLVPWLLVPLVLFQAVLGMWTVTWQLKPIVVMGHLLGGFATLSLLFLLVLLTKRESMPVYQPKSAMRKFALAALVILGLQIALGGWTSTNYAALACPDFPTCQQQWFPEADVSEAFVLWRGLGVNYEFGVLDHPARVAIHLTHRIGAIVVALTMLVLILRLLRADSDALQRAAWVVAGLTVVQISLGIGNVLFQLPLGVAVAHNGGAAMLFLSLIYVNYLLWQRRY